MPLRCRRPLQLQTEPENLVTRDSDNNEHEQAINGLQSSTKTAYQRVIIVRCAQTTSFSYDDLERENGNPQ